MPNQKQLKFYNKLTIAIQYLYKENCPFFVFVFMSELFLPL